MKKFITCLIVFVAIAVNIKVNAQQTGSPPLNFKSFEKYYDGGEISSVETVGGDLLLAKKGNIILIKTDQNGNQLFAREYLSSLTGEIVSTKMLPKGGMLLIGAVNYFTNRQSDAFIIKIDASGHFVGGKIINDPGVGNPYTYGWSVDADDDFYYLCLATKGFPGVFYGTLLVKTDTNLNLQLSYLFSDEIFINFIKKMHDGHFVIGGSCGNPVSNRDNLFLMKLDKFFNPIWTRVYGNSTGYQRGYAIIETADSNILVVGLNSENSSDGELDAFVVKTNQNGDTIFTRSIGLPMANFTHAILEKNGRYLMSGVASNENTGDSRATFFSLSKEGTLLQSYYIGASASGLASCGNSILSIGNDIFIGGVNQVMASLIKMRDDTSFDCNRENANAFFHNYPMTVYSNRSVTRTAVTPIVTVLSNTENNITINTSTNCAVMIDSTSVFVKNFTKEIIEVLPNPANDFINVKNCVGQDLFIYDSFGRKILSKKINSKDEIVNLSKLITGMYVCRIGDEFAKKILVSK